MLQIENLTITHKKDLKVLLEDFNCVLNDGDKAVIIGEEGNGKSTLLQWIFRPEMIEDYCESQGRRIFHGLRMGYLPQELSDEDKEKSIYEYFMEEDLFFGQTPKEMGRMSGKFGVPSDFFYREQRMDTLSGGERVKAQMMRLLLGKPEILLLDEPSNDIDVETLVWLERLIIGWKGIALYISHDETLIENTANMVIHMERIKKKTQSRYTVARMPYEQYMRERRKRLEKQEQMAASDRREKHIRDEKYRRVYESVGYAQETITRQNPAEIGRASCRERVLRLV